MKHTVFFVLMCMSIFFFGCDSNDKTSGPSANDQVEESIYAFQTDTSYVPSDLKLQTANFGSMCSNAFATYSASVSCTNFYPFLGKSSTNGFKNFVSTNGLKSSAVVKLIDGTTQIAKSLQDLIDAGPMVMDSNTWIGWSDPYWYSGVSSDGGVGDNCQDYADATSSTSISIGTNGSFFSWTGRVSVCDYYDDYKFICLCN